MGKPAKASNNVNSSSGVRKIPNQIKSQVSPLVQKLLKKCVNVNVPINKEFEEYKQIYGIVQDIRKIEQEYILPPPKRNGNWESFYVWCKENGAMFNSVTVKEMEKGNYGVFSEKDFEKNDLFITVPRKIMMSTEHAQDTKLCHLIKDNIMLRNMPNVALAMFLLTEYAEKSSFWRPYMCILPSNYDTILYFNIAELEILQKSPVFSQTLTICRSVARQYAYFYQLFQNDAVAKMLNIAQYFTYDLYRWAVSTVMTRQNAVPSIHGKSKIIALIPLWDMCNHSNGDFTTDFNLEKDCLEAYSMETFVKGSQVNIFYAARSNAEFFVHNGFIYPDNKNDSFTLKLGLSKNDPLFAVKTKLCKQNGIPLDGMFELKKNNIISDHLLTFLKINVLKEDEAKDVLSDKSLLDEITRQKSEELKQRALKFLKDRATLLMKSYKSTLQDDEKLLETTESERSKMAIQLVMCEKRLLKECIDYCISSTVK